MNSYWVHFFNIESYPNDFFNIESYPNELLTFMFIIDKLKL